MPVLYKKKKNLEMHLWTRDYIQNNDCQTFLPQYTFILLKNDCRPVNNLCVCEFYLPILTALDIKAEISKYVLIY